MGIIVDVILFIILAGNAVAGYKMGLAKVVFNILSTIVAIILVFILYRPVSNYVFNNTQMAQSLKSTLTENLSGLLIKETNESMMMQKEDDNAMNDILSVFMGEDMNRMIENATNVSIGENVNQMVQNTTEDMVAKVSGEIAYKIVSAIVFLGLFAIIRVLLSILRNSVDFLANLPFIRVINSSGGMVYGVVKGFLLVYVILAVLSLMAPMISDTVVLQAVDQSWVASKMFYHNILLNVIFKFL